MDDTVQTATSGNPLLETSLADHPARFWCQFPKTCLVHGPFFFWIPVLMDINMISINLEYYNLFNMMEKFDGCNALLCLASSRAQIATISK